MDKPCDLTGKAALVTGASRGIGRAVAEMLARMGAHVAVHFGVDEQAAENVLQGLAGEGHIKLSADLGDAEEASRLSEMAAEGLGRLDIVVNNAGIYVTHDIAELDPAHWQEYWNRTIAVNLSGPAHVLHGTGLRGQQSGPEQPEPIAGPGLGAQGYQGGGGRSGMGADGYDSRLSRGSWRRPDPQAKPHGADGHRGRSRPGHTHDRLGEGGCLDRGDY